MRTASSQIPWMDLRKRRAEQLTAMVMNVVGPFICQHEERYDLRKEASRKLFELFHTLGAEVITDLTRTEAGLPLRNGEGYTAEELQTLEQAWLDALYRPLTISIPLPGKTGV